MTTKVLFVCMGNICRSPTAEYVFKHRLEQRGWDDDFFVQSCGTGAWHTGNGADRRSVAAAARRGYDLSPHRARAFADEDYEFFDHIIAMDNDNHARLITECPPAAREKIRLFMDFAPELGVTEVPDPYYGEDGFDLVLDLIEAASEGFLDILEKDRGA